MSNGRLRKKVIEKWKKDGWIPKLIAGNIRGMVKALFQNKNIQMNHLPMHKKHDKSIYPRPQLVRDSYFSMDGEWDFANTDSREIPKQWGSIQVPFPPQSILSSARDKEWGIEPLKESFWYRKVFMLPHDFTADRGRILLHFGAADQIADVYINGRKAGFHEGGYLPFTVDATEYLHREGKNELAVRITDALWNKYPYGKQCKKRGGMWYTEISGIWQSVWMEWVPEEYIEDLKITPSLQGVHMKVAHKGCGFWKKPRKKIVVQMPDGIMEKEFCEDSIFIEIPNGQLWSPEHPYLYQFTLQMEEDKVSSYFALRTVTIEERNGREWMCLNGEPYYFHGVLDQGYYSDGIYTAPSLTCFEDDIRFMKELGFNTLRKHIKIEPAYFYYMCDKLGMIVFQDMVNNGKYSFMQHTAMPTIKSMKKDDKKIKVPKDTKEFFEQHVRDTMSYLYSFPSVCYYTLFNEGWGQYESDRIYEDMKAYDSTRVIDSTSGWFWQEKSDVCSFHAYFHPIWLTETKRPIMITECGGYSYRIQEHSFNPRDSYGYGTYHSKEEYTDAIICLYRNEVIPSIRLGMNGTVYTQLSDVEDETNGIYTYDRKVCKVEKERIAALWRELDSAMKEAVKQDGNSMP